MHKVWGRRGWQAQLECGDCLLCRQGTWCILRMCVLWAKQLTHDGAEGTLVSSASVSGARCWPRWRAQRQGEPAWMPGCRACLRRCGGRLPSSRATCTRPLCAVQVGSRLGSAG